MISQLQISAYIMALAKYIRVVHSENLYQTIVDAPFIDKLKAVQLDLGIVVLLIANKQTNTIDRIALSNTELAKGAVKVSKKPFHEIKIPLDNDKNIIAKSIRENKQYQTSDWKALFIPELTPDEARLNQASAGIGCSVVSPFITNDTIGAVIYSFFQPAERITNTHYTFIDKYTKIIRHKL